MASTEDGFTIDFLFVKSSELFIPRYIYLKFKKVKVLGAGVGAGAGGFKFTHSEPEPAQNGPAPKH